MSKSVAAVDPDARAPFAQAHSNSGTARFYLTVFCGFAIALSLCWPKLMEIWRTGDFHDTDDAMRMVQVRAFLAGQAWYDLTAWRLDPPAGSFMHWSRVVDVPLALLMKFFGLFAPPERAELVTRLAFPLSLQLALLFSTAWLGRVVAGPAALIPTVALTVLSGFMLGQFVPGRVDHHAPQIVLLVLMTAALLEALDPARAKFAAVSGLCVALSLSISIENIHFIAVLGAILPIAWVFYGATMRRPLAMFGLGLGAALMICFVAFNGPARWLVPACDAFSIVYLLAGVLGALTCCICALPLRQFATMTGRFSGAAFCGVMIAAVVWIAFPQCMGDPFVGLDPLVREIWLANVTEVRSLAKLLALFPDAWPMLTLPTLLGIAGLGVGAALESGVARERLMALTALAVIGAAVACLAIRAASSLAPLSLMGGVVFIMLLTRRLRRYGAFVTGAAAVCGVVLFSPIFWVLATPATDNPAEEARLAGGATCRAASAYSALANLPPGVILAPIDSGAHILAHTPHSVFGAPYHRNNHGNRLVLDAFLSSPDAARTLVEKSGAKYVAVCPGQVQLGVMAARAPDSLAAHLLAGEIPAWMQSLDLPATPYKVFILR